MMLICIKKTVREGLLLLIMMMLLNHICLTLLGYIGIAFYLCYKIITLPFRKSLIREKVIKLFLYLMVIVGGLVISGYQRQLTNEIIKDKFMALSEEQRKETPAIWVLGARANVRQLEQNTFAVALYDFGWLFVKSNTYEQRDD